MMRRQYGYHVCSKQDPLSYFKALKMRIFGSWRQEIFRDNNIMGTIWFLLWWTFSFVKFEKHWFYISRDVVYSVFYQICGKPHDVITLLICIKQNTSISLKRKKIMIPRRKDAILIFLKSVSNKQQLFFYFYRHFKELEILKLTDLITLHIELFMSHYYYNLLPSALFKQ